MTRRSVAEVFTRRRLGLGAAVLAALAAAAGGVGWFAVRPALLLDAAEQALRRNDPAAAAARLDRYRAVRPHDERGLFLAAQAARRSGAFADAERLLAEHEQAAGTTADARLEWTLLGAQQGVLTADDEAALRAAVARRSANASLILEAVARGNLAAYRYADAVQALDALLALDPDHVPGLVTRAAVSERLRSFEDAERDLRRAVEVAPGDATARVALAGFLTRTGHTAEAIAQFEHARPARPTDPELLLGLARALADDAQLDAATQRLDELLAAHPDNVPGLVERGRLAVRRNRFADAEPDLDRAARAAPWHRDAKSLLLLVRTELKKDTADCAARLDELAKEDATGGRLKLRARDNPGDAAVRAELWQWSRRTGQAEEGVAWLTEILRIDPKNVAAHAALADYFEQAGQPRRAARHRAAGGPTK